IPPLVMDPVNAQVLYFGTNRVYRTADAAESWTPVSPVLVTTNGAVSAIAPAAGDPGTVYAGTNTGLLHITRDTGRAWVQRSVGLPQRAITDIAVDRADALTAYVTVSGFGTGHVFRTINGGQSWSNVSANLPDMPVNAVLVDPASRGVVMIGTDLGVFVSADSGGSWNVLDDGMPNVAVFDLAYNPATASLTAATHGRGMFQLQLNRPLTLAVVPRRRKITVIEGAAPTRDSAVVVLTGVGAGGAMWSATHARPNWVTIESSGGTGGGRVTWTRNITGLAPGIYVDSIMVSTTGAIDSPTLLVDTLVVEASIAVLSLSPAARRDTASAGTTALRADSAGISLPGLAGARTTWTASARKGTWVTLTTAAGTGSGTLRWNRNPTGLNAGVHVDTIAINAGTAVGSPGLLLDSLIILPTLTLSAATRRDTLLSGSTGTSAVTRQLTVGGDPSGAIRWTVTHGAASWLTLVTTAGQGSGPISWTKSAANLRDGVFVDTITVNAGSARMTIVDSLVVSAPAVTRDCAVNHIFGVSCLDASQLRWLDLAGNQDGQYNLGDLLAFLARGGSSPAGLRPRKQ
ncbi:MAG: WD40/YVTN/BNR-like repeat-containing protein, partial [Longimicrobiales bacterium]